MTCRIIGAGGAAVIVCGDSAQFGGACAEDQGPIRWPATDDELKRAGYVDTFRAKTCGCGKPMCWYKTPAGKWIPLSMLDRLHWTPHWAVCTNAKLFRRAMAEHRHRFERPAPESKQMKLFSEVKP